MTKPYRRSATQQEHWPGPRQVFRLDAASLRHIRATAALAADLLCDEIHQFTGLDARGLVSGHASNQANLAIAAIRPEHDDANPACS